MVGQASCASAQEKERYYTMKKRKSSFNPSTIRCCYCGSSVTLRSAEGIVPDAKSGTMLYVCRNYPRCDSYVKVHPGTKLPMGSLANKELRLLRRKAHYHFDQLYETGFMSRVDAYEWLSAVLGLPMGKTHIGQLGPYYCQQVIDESKKLLHAQKGRINRSVKHQPRKEARAS